MLIVYETLMSFTTGYGFLESFRRKAGEISRNYIFLKFLAWALLFKAFSRTIGSPSDVKRNLLLSVSGAFICYSISSLFIWALASANRFCISFIRWTSKLISACRILAMLIARFSSALRLSLSTRASCEVGFSLRNFIFVSKMPQCYSPSFIW